MPEVAFSDSLLCGGARGNIFDTLRQADRNRDAKKPRTEQKMVDTALTCDLLQLARSEKDRTFLIVGDDDDLLPAAITAEQWLRSGDGQVLVLRPGRPRECRFLNTHGLVCPIGGDPNE